MVHAGCKAPANASCFQIKLGVAEPSHVGFGAGSLGWG